MGRKVEVNDFDFGIYLGYGIISENEDEYGIEHEGVVFTEFGIVKVYSTRCKGRRKDEWAFVEFIKNNRLYVRKFNKFYSTRYLVTLAKSFAKEISYKVAYQETFRKGDVVNG